MEWQRIETAPKEDYEMILVAVPNYEQDGYVHRLAMWDPENDDWTIFNCEWPGAQAEWWTPLLALPEFDPRGRRRPRVQRRRVPVIPAPGSDDDEIPF